MFLWKQKASDDLGLGIQLQRYTQCIVMRQTLRANLDRPSYASISAETTTYKYALNHITIYCCNV